MSEQTQVGELEGRELDAAVAREVTHLTVKDIEYVDPLSGYTVREIPHYSSDIAAAWEVVGAVLATHESWWFSLDRWADGDLVAEFQESGLGHHRHGVHECQSAPEAICRAALKAVRSHG